MLKDIALSKNPLMFDPWAKILLLLKQTRMLATANYWLSSFLLRSPGWNDPAQQRPLGKYTSAEVHSTGSGLPDSLYKDLHNQTNRQRWRNFALNESQIHMARQINQWISQSSGTGAGHTGRNDLTRVCTEPHMSFSPWRTIPSWNAFHKRSSMALRPVDV